MVSIPSSGSIQFLLNGTILHKGHYKGFLSQSPQAGQFNSYQQLVYNVIKVLEKSQSPQAGQFNSYLHYLTVNSLLGIMSQSPQAGQFNSYLRK